MEPIQISRGQSLALWALKTDLPIEFSLVVVDVDNYGALIMHCEGEVQVGGKTYKDRRRWKLPQQGGRIELDPLPPIEPESTPETTESAL